MTASTARPADALAGLAAEVHACRRCPRLVKWRERSAADPPRRFQEGEEYWGRPVEGFGDPGARIVLIGLAPAAHGANRTGRMFTGDRSGEWLYAALHRAALASRPRSERRGDGLELRGAFVTAVNRCPPPQNKPTPAERDNCLPFLERELALLDRSRVLVALGGWGWDGALRAAGTLGDSRGTAGTLADSHAEARAPGVEVPRPKPRFAHGAEADLGRWTLLGCYHPSQQNTFTGRLTEPMLDAVLTRARELAGHPDA